MFAMGWIGGGDAKLVSATAVWMGWSLLMPYLAIASIFGGLLTILLLMFRRFRLPMFLKGKAWAERLHKPRGGIPYGVALAASALCFYPSSHIAAIAGIV
jgi:prepilin peptidase CpaA